MNASNFNKPFGPHFRRVWVQGEVTSSANNGAVLVVSDGTGSMEVNTDGERKIEKGAYVCAMGGLNETRKKLARAIMPSSNGGNGGGNRNKKKFKGKGNKLGK